MSEHFGFAFLLSDEMLTPEDPLKLCRIEVGQCFTAQVQVKLRQPGPGVALVGVAKHHVADFVADDLVDVVVGGSGLVEDEVLGVGDEPQSARAVSECGGVDRNQPDWTSLPVRQIVDERFDIPRQGKRKLTYEVAQFGVRDGHGLNFRQSRRRPVVAARVGVSGRP